MESCRAEQRDSLWFKVRQCYFTNLRIFQRALAGWPSYVALLFVVAMLNFGPSLAYNMSSALGAPFHKGANMTVFQEKLMYRVDHWTRVVCCFFGGHLIDVIFGSYLGGMTCSVVLICSHGILCGGVMAQNRVLIEFSRFLLALASGLLQIVSYTYAVYWFPGALNIAFAGLSVISCIGFSFSAPMYKALYKVGQQLAASTMTTKDDLAICLAIGSIGSFGTLLAAFYLTKQKRKRSANHAQLYATTLEHLETSTSMSYNQYGISDIGSDDDEDIILMPPPRRESLWTQQLVSYVIAILDIDFKTNRATFLSCIILAISYSSFFLFYARGQVILAKLFGMSEAMATKYVFTCPLLSMMLTITFGLMIQKTGKESLWVICALILSLFGIGIFVSPKVTLANLSPWIPITFITMAFSILECSLKPMISYYVQRDRLGITYGSTMSLSYGIFAILLLIEGQLTRYHEYGAFVLGIASMIALALILATYMAWHIDALSRNTQS